MTHLDTYRESEKRMTNDPSDSAVKVTLQERVDRNVSPYIICK